MANIDLIIGVDPGASGGLAELYTGGSAIVHPMMDDVDLRDYFDNARTANPGLHVVMELVGGYVGGSGQPGSAMFKFGEGYGFIQGLLVAYRIPLHLVRPQTWQQGIPGLKGNEKPQRKRAIKEHASRLFPFTKGITLKTADALCIAEWGRRNLLG